ncbi:NAD(P)-dependent oxidoreductase [Erythrobacter sp. JK5]|uniref:NAD-dependent epimerase/dehydratase family protein n=1 Tax=Erythrobacter sp. JK5 TaxID=2829500 RepID=UPI002012EA1D|nr:NAD(P)-dependent oxidoreductase [Erythrobacter sp. JK5]
MVTHVAITGATGFVGHATLDAALAKGLRVRALTRRNQHARERVEWVSGTLDNDAALAELATGVDAVIHIAGLTNTPDTSEFDRANVAGTQRMLAATGAAGIRRFVFVSSLSAREPELSAYGASKARAEELVKASDLEWTIVRPPGVYGPRDKDYLDLFKAAKLGIVPVPPAGRSSLIHVEDLARLLIALACAGSIATHRTYEPWDDNPYGYEHTELAQMIGEAVGRSQVFAPSLPEPLLQIAARIDKALRGHKAKLTEDRVGYMVHPDWVCDVRKAPPLSLWQAVWDGEAGLKMTAEWYREQGWL